MVRARRLISYGIRGDSELLLNYGFMRGVTMDGVGNDKDLTGIRKRLAASFLSKC